MPTRRSQNWPKILPYAQHGRRPLPWTYAQYGAQVSVYRRAIARAVHGIRFAGPDVSGSKIFATWGRREARAQRPALLTGHHYPLGCEELPAPSIPRLLSARVHRREGNSLRRYTSISQASEISFRLDETNTVSCGGRAGISDTFASALWAVSYIVHTMQAGVAGVNLWRVEPVQQQIHLTEKIRQ